MADPTRDHWRYPDYVWVRTPSLHPVEWFEITDIGPSLNAIHKNEAVALEPGADDSIFFDKVWTSASQLE